MNTYKRFTEGLAFFACFLILIFILYSAASFKKPPSANPDTGKIPNFTEKNGVREYIRLFVALFASAVVCSLTDKLPFIGLATAPVPLCFVLKYIKEKKLVFCRPVIFILTVIFVAGEITAVAIWLRRLKNRGTR